jgi:hypothetical protein
MQTGMFVGQQLLLQVVFGRGQQNEAPVLSSRMEPSQQLPLI